MSTWRERVACGLLVSKIHGHFAVLLKGFSLALNPVRADDQHYAESIVLLGKDIYNQLNEQITFKHRLWSSHDVPRTQQKRMETLDGLRKRFLDEVIVPLQDLLPPTSAFNHGTFSTKMAQSRDVVISLIESCGKEANGSGGRRRGVSGLFIELFTTFFVPTIAAIALVLGAFVTVGLPIYSKHRIAVRETLGEVEWRSQRAASCLRTISSSTTADETKKKHYDQLSAVVSGSKDNNTGNGKLGEQNISSVLIRARQCGVNTDSIHKTFTKIADACETRRISDPEAQALISQLGEFENAVKQRQ